MENTTPESPEIVNAPHVPLGDAASVAPEPVAPQIPVEEVIRRLQARRYSLQQGTRGAFGGTKAKGKAHKAKLTQYDRDGAAVAFTLAQIRRARESRA